MHSHSQPWNRLGRQKLLHLAHKQKSKDSCSNVIFQFYTGHHKILRVSLKLNWGSEWNITRFKILKLWFLLQCAAWGTQEKQVALHRAESSDGCLTNGRTISGHNRSRVACLSPSRRASELNAEVCFRRTTAQREHSWETKWMLHNVFS